MMWPVSSITAPFLGSNFFCCKMMDVLRITLALTTAKSIKFCMEIAELCTLIVVHLILSQEANSPRFCNEIIFLQKCSVKSISSTLITFMFPQFVLCFVTTSK